MEDLRSLMRDLGFSDTRTLLQSGNVVFSAEKGSHAESISKALRERHQINTLVLVYTDSEWATFIKGNPMPKEAAVHPSRYLLCLAQTPFTNKGLETATKHATHDEKVAVVGGRLYLSLPQGIGTSKMLASREWAKYASLGTMRNWNTVTKLAELAGLSQVSN